jgi:ANTAR domain
MAHMASFADAREIGPRARPSGTVPEGRADGDPLFAGVAAICDDAVRQTGLDGVTLAVLTRSGRVRQLVYASDPIAQRLDELQFTIGEGPCLDAFFDEAPQLYPELTSVALTSRWPTFASEATELGVQALFAFPVPDRSRPMGVLEFYRRTAGGLADAEPASGTICAAMLAQRLDISWQDHVARFGNTERAVDEAAITGAAQQDPTDPFSRSQVHVAAGMVAVQLGVSAGEGVDRLRAYSYARGRPLSSVAADVVARRLDLTDQRDLP